ncbi:general substrate transporter [Trichodelitschia bisporula]|uniref:General substrate transporter n=1 Tax=Trichodelitschia bisporula TaxID=703511 RepID=A0A6G1HPC1_9PEZI|nr:general substrate transporter [Trichodelitschia bisporula]
MDPRSWFKDLTSYFLFILFVATLGPLLFGYHIAELNAPQDVITCQRKSLSTTVPTSLPQCIRMTPAQIGLVSSIFTAGGLVGALAAGPLSARHGRLKTMRLTTIFFIIGPVFEALAPNIGVLALGRFISGIGAGSSVVTVPIYISETAPPAEKGFFGSLTQVMVNCGIFLSQLLGYFFSHDQMWRVILAVGGVVGVAQAVGLLFSVESPKWTAEHVSPRTAKAVLQKIRGSKADIDEEFSTWAAGPGDDPADAEEPLLGDASSGSTKPRRIIGMLEVLRHPDTKKPVFAIIMVMVAQQFTGINSIIMYGVALLADLLQSNSALLNLSVSALNIAVTAGCAPLVDKLGRKTCLLSSIAGMGVSSLLLAIGITRSIQVLSAVAVLLFVASFALGLGPIPFILSAELVGPEAVAATQGWALGASWVSTFVVAQFFPMVNAWLGKGKVYFIFAGLAAFFWCFVAWIVPETKGKKDADEVWGRARVRSD